MPKIEGKKCCGRSSCIVRYFKKVYLGKDILEIAVTARADYRAEEINNRSSNYRKAAYYEFCLWRYGKLGKGNRRVIPSCVVKLIRTDIPNQERLTWALNRHNILQSCSKQLNSFLPNVLISFMGLKLS